MSSLFAFTRVLFIISLFTIFHYSIAHNTALSSSCGNITNITHPFILKDKHSLYLHIFELNCRKNHTVIWVGNPLPKLLYVVKINYEEKFIRVVDPGISTRGQDLFSCPLHHLILIDHFSISRSHLYINSTNSTPIAFIHCLTPINSTKYVKSPFCGNRSNMFANSSIFYSYIIVVDNLSTLLSDLEESCTIDTLAWTSLDSSTWNDSSLATIYNALAYGFQLSWIIKDCSCELHLFIYFCLKSLLFKSVLLTIKKCLNCRKGLKNL